MSKTSSQKLIRRVSLVLTLLALTACHSDQSKRVGQAVATVNGTDITVHQVNDELRSIPNASSVNPAELQKRALDQVIDRNLLAEQAVQTKLDRDPAVLMAIERNKQQLLAQAYLEKRISSSVKPSKAEVDDYVAKHPELFQDRKVYNLRFLAIPGASASNDLSSVVDKSSTLDAVAAELKTRSIPFSAEEGLRSSADLPAELLTNADVTTKGKLFVIRANDKTLVASLTYVKDTPVTGEDAYKQAEQYLANRKAMSATKDEIARLRAAAKIEYAKGEEPKAAPAAPSAPAAADGANNGANNGANSGPANDASTVKSGMTGLR